MANASNGNGRRKVVITGMGTLNPLGNSVPEFWEGALAGKSGVDWLTQVDSTGYETHIAGEVKNFAPEEYIDRKEARRMARFSQLALAASVEAFKMARLDPRAIENPYRAGVLFGNGMGGYPDTD
jgi:3-oxoacyl-[acyl-carrier-protein] synthase II